MKHRCTAVAPVMMALILSASGRPFNDPRSEKSDAIDQAAANEPRDQACYVGDAGPARSLSAGIGQCREKCRPGLCPRQTFSRGNSRSRTETGSNIGRDQFESQCLGAGTLARCFLGRAKRKKQQHTI
jgi:hypothetical protein